MALPWDEAKKKKQKQSEFKIEIKYRFDEIVFNM